MKVESIVEYSPWSILQYFWPALSNNWSWKPIFGLFESGHFTEVLLYIGIRIVKNNFWTGDCGLLLKKKYAPHRKHIFPLKVAPMRIEITLN